MYSIVAVSGSKLDLDEIRPVLQSKFDRYVEFPLPDDHGEFPDTSGYTREDYEKLLLTEEDTQLYPYMLKCIDAIDDIGNKKAESYSKLGMQNVELVIHGHTFGGKVFAIVGFVHYTVPKIPFGKKIIVAQG